MSVNLQTLKDIRNYLANELKEIYPEREISSLTSIIVYTVLGIQKLRFTRDQDLHLSEEDSEKVVSICAALKKGIPIQYITGETVFYNCRIKVTTETLIPRQETEELADLVIKENRGYSGRILDIGTGSGCIAIALALNLPDADISGIDISEGAIKVARENARLNNADVSFIVGDILNPDIRKTGATGMIVSNPPYVRESEKQFMSVNVLRHEPHIALFVPDEDPLVFYRAVLDLAGVLLETNGRIYFEMNEAMGTQLSELLDTSGYSGISIINDINGKQRIIKAVKNA
ncbi:MAG: peptide chain release factor N(5)-glutamine methyltransferase [Bacteroidales bacterium]|nr:peptide chain release factor N(5)-glutamine methyltransferase [Bacteroidales bacterium]